MLHAEDPAMGSGLQASGRDIVYSCSWPAYLGGNESAKPWAAMIAAGCNSWRNWEDIQCDWGVLSAVRLTVFAEFVPLSLSLSPTCHVTKALICADNRSLGGVQRRAGGVGRAGALARPRHASHRQRMPHPR